MMLSLPTNRFLPKPRYITAQEAQTRTGRHQALFLWAFRDVHNFIEKIGFSLSGMKALHHDAIGTLHTRAWADT